MTTTELLLIDLSSLAYPIYKTSSAEPDPDHASTQIVARVRSLASGHPHAAVCCDSGRSFRHDLSPRETVAGKIVGYKANRPEKEAAYLHQVQRACERLRGDGFPIWTAEGFEADDIIATATAEALKIDPSVTVLIVSADKDMYQLVSDRVRIKKPSNGAIVDVAYIAENGGLTPAQMVDYLSLTGDTSDNIEGAKGIGGVIAAELLKAHGSIEAIYQKMDCGVVPGITPARRTSLMEFRERWPLTRDLITLRTDVPIAFAEIAVEREVKPMDTETEAPESAADELSPAVATSALSEATARVAERLHPADAPIASGAVPPTTAGLHSSVPNEGGSALIPAPVQLTPMAPRDYTLELDPRTPDEAVKLAQRLYDSRLFSAYGTPQAVLSTILAGRELGMPAMASLRAFHIIEGKPTLSAGAIQSLVMKSKQAKYFRCSERTPERATFVTQRGDDPEMALTFSVEEGRRAFGFTDDMTPQARAEAEKKWQRSGWGKNPADLCVARAASKLARLVYPDVVSGLYAPEEFE